MKNAVQESNPVAVLEMVSTKEIVTFHGTLIGQGQEADCMVSATKVTVPGGLPAYTHYSVAGVRKALPEGDYDLLLATGEKILVRYHGGYWLARGL